jgi:hypothetical protein
MKAAASAGAAVTGAAAGSGYRNELAERCKTREVLMAANLAWWDALATGRTPASPESPFAFTDVSGIAADRGAFNVRKLAELNGYVGVELAENGGLRLDVASRELWQRRPHIAFLRPSGAVISPAPWAFLQNTHMIIQCDTKQTTPNELAHLYAGSERTPGVVQLSRVQLFSAAGDLTAARPGEFASFDTAGRAAGTKDVVRDLERAHAHIPGCAGYSRVHIIGIQFGDSLDAIIDLLLSGLRPTPTPTLAASPAGASTCT